MRPRLRLFGDTPLGEDALSSQEPVAVPDVTIPLSDLIGVLRDAVDSDRVWLEDFGDEDVRVSQDLYDILSAYERMRSAA